MMVQQHAVDVAANNLANASTSGFRKGVVAFRAFPEGEMVRIERSGSDSPEKAASRFFMVLSFVMFITP